MTPQEINTDRDAVWITPFAVLGQIFSIGVSLALAHLLAPEAFEAYVMAASLFILLMALAPLGSEKLALRVLPPLLDAGLWADVRGFLGFAARRSLFGTVLALMAVLIWAWLWGDPGALVWQALALVCLTLPFGVTTQVGQEVLTAAGRGDLALFAARVLPPLVAGLALTLAWFAGWAMGSTLALGGWLLGWAFAAVSVIAPLRRVLAGRAQATSRFPLRDWARAARPLWSYRLATGLRAQAGIIALLWFGAASGQIGAFATAQALTGLFLVPVTATNRIYARALSRSVHRGDQAAIQVMLRRRLGWVLPWVFSVIGLVWWGGERLLGLLRPDFIEAGTGALRVLTLAAAASMLMALEPTWLKYLNRGRQVLIVMAGSAGVHLGLLMVLVPHFDAFGAALAYAIPTTFGYAILSGLARAERPGAPPPPASG